MYISIILTTIILRAQNALDVRAASWILDTCRAKVDFDVLPLVGARRVTGNHGDGLMDGWMDDSSDEYCSEREVGSYCRLIINQSINHTFYPLPIYLPNPLLFQIPSHLTPFLPTYPLSHYSHHPILLLPIPHYSPPFHSTLPPFFPFQLTHPPNP